MSKIKTKETNEPVMSKESEINPEKLKSGKERMALGAILSISVVLMFMPMSKIPTKPIAALMIVGVAIYLMLS